MKLLSAYTRKSESEANVPESIGFFGLEGVWGNNFVSGYQLSSVTKRLRLGQSRQQGFVTIVVSLPIPSLIAKCPGMLTWIGYQTTGHTYDCEPGAVTPLRQRNPCMMARSFPRHCKRQQNLTAL